MKIKLDENLPMALAEALRRLGHEVDSVMDEGLAGRDDEAVWAACQAEGRFFITQDLDFSDLRRFLPGRHHGLLIVRLVQPGRRALTSRVRSLFETEAVDSWARGFVVASDRKVRVRRPQPVSEALAEPRVEGEPSRGLSRPME